MIDLMVPVFLSILLCSIVAAFTFISAIGQETTDHSRTEPIIESPASVSPSIVAEPLPDTAPEPAIEQPKQERLHGGLRKTRKSFLTSLSSLFKGEVQFSAAMLDNIHEILYRADVGSRAADLLVASCKQQLTGQVSLDTVKTLLRDEVAKVLALPNAGHEEQKKKVILMVGVNGVGKTTTIGKLAHHYLHKQKSVLICAADTFRAAAIDQLQVWADRLEVDLVKHKQGADPGAVVYDAVQSAKKRHTDVLLVDTAGRLHNKEDLMAELGNIKKVASKHTDLFTVETWIVLDATSGQNAVQQVKVFLELIDLSGIVVTKLDGTAKGGVLIGICEQFKIPVQFVGIGEQQADLRRFDPQEVANSMFMEA